MNKLNINFKHLKTQKLISYYLFYYNLNIFYFKYIILKKIIFILIYLFFYKKFLDYFIILYLFLKFINYKIYFDIIKYINFNIKFKNFNFKQYNKLNFLNKIKYKILEIKKISKTTKKGRNKKFKIICLSGNYNNWFGLGQSSDIELLKAINKAYKNSLKNIYIINKNKLKNFYNYNFFLKYKSSYLLINSLLKNKGSVKGALYLKNLFELSGCNNINTKIIKSHNKLNILKAFLKQLILNNNKYLIINFNKLFNINKLYLKYIINSLKLLINL
uniref:30S ribosomal protein S5 n=1 Tax=Nephromyces sp. ex Molgula occidentalis TaxID=2544991 RepID=A0A5C1H8I8_9APIC|nr:30S ribosomal protein S5 [Nephromyces sp. ex Molgula occidentalis]